MKILFFILFFQLFLYSNSEKKDLPMLEKALIEGDSIQEKLSERLEYYATDIDNFLSDEPNEEVYKNPTYAHIELTAEKTANGDYETKGTVKIRLKLPKFKEKYRIEIGNDKETNDKSNDIRVNDITNEEDFRFGLGYVDTLKKYVNFSAGVGIKVKLNELDPYIKSKLSKDSTYWNDWKGETVQKFFYSNRKKFETTTSHEIYKVFNERFKFSSYNEYFWQEPEQDDNFYNSFRLYQNLSQKDYLGYIVSAATNNDNSSLKVKNYQTYITYRHYMKKWLYYDVIPRYIWQRSDGFGSNFALRFNFGMFIGKK